MVQPDPTSRGIGVVHRLVKGIARTSAIVGGLVLTFLVVLTTLSIVGRSLSKAMHSDWAETWLGALSDFVIRTGIDEIKGTYELTEAGVAFAIFAFLPICQFYGAHATVDVFTSGLGPRVTRILRAVWEVVLTITILFVSERLWDGMLRYWNNGETTLFLQFPVWWAYALSVGAAILACITALYCAAVRVHEAVTNRDILPQG